MNMSDLGVKAIAENELTGFFFSFWLGLPQNEQKLSFLSLTVI